MTGQRANARSSRSTRSAKKRRPGGDAPGNRRTPTRAARTSVIENQAEILTRLTETNRQLKRKIFDLYTIFEISRNFSSVLNYESLLSSFVFTSLAQVSASKAAIFLKAESHSERFVMAKGKGSGSFPGPDQYLELSSRLLTFLTKLNRPVVTTEVMRDLATEAERAILNDFHPGLIVPLIYQSRLTGILLISEKISANDFGLDDVEFLSILANQIAVSFENARLYESEKAATKQLRSAQQQLVHSERLAALGEMSARVAHEINNPLGIIKNYLLLVRRAMGGSAEATSYVDIIGQEIDRIAHIVRELLNFHRPQPVAFEPIDLRVILEDVLAMMERQFEKLRITVVRDMPKNIATVNGSPENMKQVFLNLLINACDAMSNGGQLTIVLQRQNRQLLVRFEDTGPGISPDVIPRIFEPFFTTKEPGKGTGLGLSVCYGIIKRHRGSITYRNTDTGGCFEIALPADQSDRDES